MAIRLTEEREVGNRDQRNDRLLQYLLKLRLTKLFFISNDYIILRTDMAKRRELAHLDASPMSWLCFPPAVTILHHPNTVQEWSSSGVFANYRTVKAEERGEARDEFCRDQPHCMVRRSSGQPKSFTRSQAYLTGYLLCHGKIWISISESTLGLPMFFTLGDQFIL